jgi:hypothetical protein
MNQRKPVILTKNERDRLARALESEFDRIMLDRERYLQRLIHMCNTPCYRYRVA